MLPKFLLADNSQDRPESIYVVHNDQPRCIFECHIDDQFYDNHKIHWIDEAISDSKKLEVLIRDAEKFLDDELDAQEKLFEEEFLDEEEEDEDEEK
jgi:hypothetical protein